MIKFIGFVVLFALIFTPLAPISLFIAFGLIAPYSRMSEREKARNAATKKTILDADSEDNYPPEWDEENNRPKEKDEKLY